MSRRLLVYLLFAALCPARVGAADGVLYTDFVINYERLSTEGVTLGADPALDRRLEEDLEFEFTLEYALDHHWYLFFTGALVDETERLETQGPEEDLAGLERKRIGVGYLFGDKVQSELILGRSEFQSGSERWLWWDEELDAIRIDSNFGDFELQAAIAEELARENTDAERIDPELEDLRRLLFNLTWEFSAGHSLALYYLDQRDDSGAVALGAFEDLERIDESDADLTWTGISYFGEFDVDSVGRIDIEAHAARVSGDEMLTEFDDPVGGAAEATERSRRDIDGGASGVIVGLRPQRWDDWRFRLGRIKASGDGNPDDADDDAFRQNGLQGDSEIYGEAFRPELSNLVIELIGIDWEIADNAELALYRFDYRQDERADEMRDVGIDLDPNGLSRDLGHEIDLVLTLTAREGLELIFRLAEFHAGSAYSDPDPDADKSGETAGFIGFEIDYEF